MDSLTITIIFIALSTLIGAFVKGRMRDKCLLNFEGDPVNVEFKGGKIAWGILRLEATGLELKYKEPYLDKNDNRIETSFLLYKSEYSNIRCIVRFMDDLDEEAKKKRERFLKGVYSQGSLRRIFRKIRNFFATIKDSIMEVVNLLIGRAKQATPMSGVLSSQDKYVSEMQKGVLSAMNASFEPLLEKHIGRKVVLEYSGGEKIVEYSGILRSYTAEFLELIDLAYKRGEKEESRRADIIVPRSLGLVRHLGE